MVDGTAAAGAGIRFGWRRLIVWLALLVVARPDVASADGVALFQFFAFSAGDLEILPGQSLALHGRVHANGDLYLNSSNTLSIGDDPANGILTVEVTAGRRIFRGRKDDPFLGACTGTVRIDALEDILPPAGDLDPRVLPCGERPVSTATLAAWQGSMADLTPYAAVPGPELVARGGPYWRWADLRIVLRLEATPPHTIEVQREDGTPDTARTVQLHAFMADHAWNIGTVAGRGPSTLPGTAPIFYTDVPSAAPGCGCTAGTPICASTNPACYEPAFGPPLPAIPPYPADTTRIYGRNMFDGDFRRGGFYNHREHKWMMLLNVNVADLLRWNAEHGDPFFSSDDATHGGVILFLSVVGPDSDAVNHYGARVFGSTNLPLSGGIGVVADPTGLTVASDQALYVLGDFNRGVVQAGDPSRQPAALIADSVNVLSNNYWNPACEGTSCRDGQSPLGLGNRVASTTWINAGVLCGIDETFLGNFSGGLENALRFHETWSATFLRLRGSFVTLGLPRHVNGVWCGTGTGCNIYNPPLRDFDFDPAFQDPANLPPLAPRSGCGNGEVDPGEECDDGNIASGDCCSATCLAEPAGASCADDGSPCSLDACDGAGFCTHPPGNAGLVCRPAADACDRAESCDGVGADCPADAFADGAPCDDGDPCTLGDACAAGACAPGTPDLCDDGNPCTRDSCARLDGCVHDATPPPTCRTAGASSFRLTQRGATSRSLGWRWSRGVTSPGDFGDPTADTGYAFCVLEGADVVLHATVPPGAPRWRATANGYRYKDSDASAAGISNLRLVGSLADHAQIALTGRGDALPDPDLHGGLRPPVTVLLRRDDDSPCWTQTFQPGDVSRNDANGFRARATR